MDIMRAGESRDYLAIRCSALYGALEWWGGGRKFKEDSTSTEKELRFFFFEVALIYRTDEEHREEKNTMGDFIGTEIYERTKKDFLNIQRIYMERFEFNFKLDGHPWFSDTVISSDKSLCDHLAKDVGRKVPN